MHIKVYDTDTVEQIAKKVFYEFDVMASVTIYGFVMNEQEQKLMPKGEAVLEYIRKLDQFNNFKDRENSKPVRYFKYKKDSIGGPIAHKIFTWEKRIVDSEPRYTIWRYQ